MKNKYELVMERIELLISSGRLHQSDRLPSIREMSTEFGCSKSTVVRAYKALELNHKIYSIPKSGYYLTDNNVVTPINSTINFDTVLPDPNLLPYKEFNHCINRAIEQYKSTLFNYSETQGLHSLRVSLTQHLADYQVFTTPDNVCITSGAQQALNILSHMPFPNHRPRILLEQPTYALMHQIAAIYGCQTVGITRDFDGIDFSKLEKIFEQGDIKFFYSIPRLHNPLGTSYTEKEKHKLVELAVKHDVYIVEDDYLADLDYGQQSLPLHYYDISERVVYVKSFSKTFMPGLRIGAIVLPPKLKEKFLKHKRILDLNTSVMAQGALNVFINSGMYNNHLRNAQAKYSKKMDYLKQSIAKHNTGGLELRIPTTGFFVWIKFPHNFSVKKLVKGLEKNDVYISPGSKFFIDNFTMQNSIRLCISQLSEEQIRVGLNKLFAEIHKQI